MPEKSWIQQVVEKAVSNVLDGNRERVQSELVARVLAEVEPRLAASPHGNAAGADASSLLKAISSVHAGSTQREILRALLDGAAQYAGRVALFVIKTGSATGWQARGFSDSDQIKDFALDVGGGLAAQALQLRTPACGPSDGMDSQFVARFHVPATAAVMVLPLVLKEKVAALVYADAGSDSSSGAHMDAAALELLVVTTGAWLEVVSLRKQSAKESSAEAVPAEKATAAAPSSFSDPFAAHAPAHAPAPAAPAEAGAVAQATAAALQAESAPLPDGSAGTATAVAVASDTPAGLSSEDAEIHRRAQRFARLLVDEIKLYNQVKVAEGRKNRDLYDRLKEDIDKSFTTYQKRYGNTAAASAGYFNSELVRSLAEDDASLLGANFQR